MCYDLQPERLMLYFQMGSIPHAKVLRSIERFTGEVLPLVEKECGPMAETGAAHLAGAAE